MAHMLDGGGDGAMKKEACNYNKEYVYISNIFSPVIFINILVDEFPIPFEAITVIMFITL